MEWMKMEGSVGMLLCTAFFTLHALLFTSCTPEVENTFGESAANRVAQRQADYYSILESQQWGWALDYYPSDGMQGGVVYTASFKNGEVAMSCEQDIDNSVTATSYPAGTEVSSLYQITGETGVLLTFDTYNPLFHYWSQPFHGHAKGYQSDYEFTFLSASADSVVLTGKKHGNLLRMFPLSEQPAAYIQKVVQTHSVLSSSIRKRALVDGVKHPLTMAYDLFVYSHDAKTDTVPFVYTDTGLRFYRPVTLGGITVDRLAYNVQTDELRSADGRVVLPSPTTAERFVGSTTQWYFGYSASAGASAMCDELAALVNDCAAQIKKPNWGYEVLTGIYIGSNLLAGDANHTVLGWQTQSNYGRGESAYFGYAVNMDLTDDQRQLVSLDAVAPSTNFDSHVYCQDIVDFIVGGSPYLLTFDDDQNPTTATLTSEADSGKWFRLTKGRD